MEMSSMLKNIFKHFKKTYLIFTGILIILGLILIPLISTSIASVIITLFLISTWMFSFILGDFFFSQYGKTFAIIQNNKSHLMFASIIFAVGNAVLFSLIFMLYRCTMAFNFQSVALMFTIYLMLFYIGSVFGLLIKNKSYAVTITIGVILSLAFLFFREISTYVNILKIVLFGENTHDFSNFLIATSCICLVCAIITYCCYYMLDTKKIYFKK